MLYISSAHTHLFLCIILGLSLTFKSFQLSSFSIKAFHNPTLVFFPMAVLLSPFTKYPEPMHHFRSSWPRHEAYPGHWNRNADHKRAKPVFRTVRNSVCPRILIQNAPLHVTIWHACHLHIELTTPSSEASSALSSYICYRIQHGTLHYISFHPLCKLRKCWVHDWMDI